ncbi:MAG: Por secretion system protein, partial [Duncaniella sp.]|nr:Por secretion system protein [Duncaniella sp.]
TILGQTAPGEGIQVYGNRVSFSGADNLIVRHMRFRMGTPGDSGKDACGIANGENMIFDHLSVLWGKDENFSVSWDNKGTRPGKITIQNSIIGQGLQSHSCGGLIQTDGGVTLYRNLYIENKTRNPKVKGVNQYVNNVVYNWGDGGGYIMGDTEGASWAHIENNYFMRGPWTGTKPFTRGSSAFHYYGAGNWFDNNKDGVLNGDLLTVEEMNGKQADGRESTWVESLDALNNKVIHEVIHEGTGSSINYDVILSEQDRTIPVQIPAISNVMTAAEAYAWMTTNVGPCLPAYDEVDQYIIDELCSYGKTGTYNGISNETTQLPHKGIGTLSGGVKPTDTDGDGIPDAWETANGLNPNDASDAKAIAANGYANIENYSFSITEAYPYIKKPVKLAVTRQGKTELDLSWDLNKNTTNGFKIETSVDNGSTWTKLGRATGADGKDGQDGKD